MADAPPPPPPPVDPTSVGAAIVETSLLGYAVVDADLRFTYANRAMADQLGCTAEELIGTSGLDAIHPADRAVATEAIAQFLDGTAQFGDLGVPLRFRLVRRDGTPVTMELGALALLDHPVLQGFVIRSAPLRGQGEIDAALGAMARDADLSEILDLLLDAVDGVVADGRAVLVVEELPSRTQWSVPDELPRALVELPGPTDATDPRGATHPGVEALERGEVVVRLLDELPAALREVAGAEGFAACWAFPLVTRSFRAVALVWRTIPRAPLISSREVIERIVGIVGLAIERHRARLALEHAATHDPLTGLTNRGAFAARLDREAAARGVPGRRLGVLYLDLDGFKPINDAHGHDAGDAVLREAGRRITDAVRETDVVARIGGDEFAVLCPDVESAEVLPLVATRIIEAFVEPFPVAHTTAAVGVSVGIAMADLADGAPADADALLAQADAALYQAKRSGRGRWAM